MFPEHDTVDVFIGIDVGKTAHHAVAIDRTGKKLLDKPLPQDEAKLRALINKVSGHGRILVFVDQPATIGPGHGRHGRLSPRSGDAPHRRPPPR